MLKIISYQRNVNQNSRKYHFTSPKMAIIKKITSIGNVVENLEFSYIADWNVKWCSHSGKQPDSSSNGWTSVITWSSNFTLSYAFKRNENVCPHKNICKNVHSSIIHNIQKNWKQPKCPSVGKWMKCSMEYYVVVKRNKPLLQAIVLMNLKINMLNEGSQSEKKKRKGENTSYMIPFVANSRKCKQW